MRGSLPVQRHLFKAGGAFTPLPFHPSHRHKNRCNDGTSQQASGGTDMPCFLNKWFFCRSYAFVTDAMATNMFRKVHSQGISNAWCCHLQAKVSQNGDVAWLTIKVIESIVYGTFENS